MQSKRGFYIAIAILAAALTWFYVSNNETVAISVDNLPVEFQNEETTLADRGLMLLNGEEATVSLKLQLPRSLVFKLDPDDIRIVADLSSVTSAGKQSLSFSVLYPSNVSTRNITVESPIVRTIQVEIGELSRKEVEVRCKVVGNVAEGYTAGSLELAPSVLELRGQQEDLMNVNYAAVTLNIDNATSTIVELLDYTLYDFNEQVIENNNIHPVTDQIEVKLPVMTVKEIPLVVDFIETAGARLDSFTYEQDYETITVSGDASVVSAMEEVKLGTLDLKEINGDEVIVYEVILPDGVENLSGISLVTLTFGSGDLVTKELTATRFNYENADENDKVSVVTTSLHVTLRGKQSDVEAVTADKVTVIADLSGITNASGNYTVPATIHVDGYDIGTVGNYEVNVHIGSLN